jgi:HAD superfamily 5'-nucleotidase-like hydrolase
MIRMIPGEAMRTMIERHGKRIGLHRLSPETHDFPHIDEDSIVKSRRIFVNRNLKTKSIRTIGFDLDHTLAVYAKESIESLAFEETKKKLIQEKGYPRELAKLAYDPEFVIRGLVVDKLRGNIIKMNKHKYVVVAYHGKRRMSRTERKATYANKRLTIYDADYRSIDTLFSLPEVDLFAQIIDQIEVHGLACKTPYSTIFDDIRICIDKAHQDGSIKNRVMSNLDRYFIKDPKLPLTLDKFIRGGKTLYLLTNSGWEYTNRVMGHLLSGELDEYPEWRDFFAVVIIDADKPRFFAAGSPLAALEPNGAEGADSRHRAYRGGSSQQFEELIGMKGEEILYFGDHTHADILKSKKTSGWRTAMIIEELEKEVVSSEKVRRTNEELDQIEELNSELRFQSNLLSEKAQIGKDTKTQDYGSLADDELARLDKDVEANLRRVIRIEQKITENLKRSKLLEAEVERAFNPYWGQLFKAGRENSRFGDQVEEFACVYASRVSNFLHYPVNKYYQTAREMMPHET